jgi:hypothetical protein
MINLRFSEDGPQDFMHIVMLRGLIKLWIGQMAGLELATGSMCNRPSFSDTWLMNLLAFATVPNDADLQTKIRQHEQDWQSNPAVKALINDFAREHIVVALIGGLFAAGLAILSVILLGRYRSARHDAGSRSAANTKMYFRAMLLSGFVGFSLGLVVLVNAGTALNPAPGFFMAVAPTTPNGKVVDTALAEWVESGDTVMPAVLENKVSERIAWQRPKAIICGLLFVLFGSFATKSWRRRLRISVISGPHQKTARFGLFVKEASLFSLSLLTMVMFIANTGYATAPITITMFGGS